MKTRSRTKQGDTIDLLSDPEDEDGESRSQVTEQIETHQRENPKQIGDIGYTFQKYFNAGWFTGTVVEIRHGAGKKILAVKVCLSEIMNSYRFLLMAKNC